MTHGREARLKLPKITEALLRKDYSGDDICKILGGNMLCGVEQTEKVSKGLLAL